MAGVSSFSLPVSYDFFSWFEVYSQLSLDLQQLCDQSQDADDFGNQWSLSTLFADLEILENVPGTKFIARKQNRWHAARRPDVAPT